MQCSGVMYSAAQRRVIVVEIFYFEVTRKSDNIAFYMNNCCVDQTSPAAGAFGSPCVLH